MLISFPNSLPPTMRRSSPGCSPVNRSCSLGVLAFRSVVCQTISVPEDVSWFGLQTTSLQSPAFDTVALALPESTVMSQTSAVEPDFTISAFCFQSFDLGRSKEWSLVKHSSIVASSSLNLLICSSFDDEERSKSCGRLDETWEDVAEPP